MLSPTAQQAAQATHFRPRNRLVSFLRRLAPPRAAAAGAASPAAVDRAGAGAAAAPGLLVPETVAPSYDLAAVAALPPHRQGSMVPYAPMEGPQAWLGSDFADLEAAIVHLTPAHIEELEAAVAAVLATGRVRPEGNNLAGLTAVTESDFSLPTLGPLLRSVGHEVESGRGFALLRRLPIERWDRVQTLVAYWICGLHWGVPMEQNQKRHVIGHVKDVGVDPDNKNPNTRIYMTRAAQPWHVDSCDVVGLLCLNEAKEGGNSGWASSATIINIIREEAPELLPVLAGPWFLDRKGEVEPGVLPVFDMPILHYSKGHQLVAFHDSYYQLADQKWGGAATLSKQQIAALDKFREVANRVAIQTRLSPGDLQLVNNHTVVHTRSAYKDWEDESGAKRHLLRLWIATPPPRAPPLPVTYRHMWKRFAADERGMAQGDDGRWAFAAGGQTPLEAEVGQLSIPDAPRAR